MDWHFSEDRTSLIGLSIGDCKLSEEAVKKQLNLECYIMDESELFQRFEAVDFNENRSFSFGEYITEIEVLYSAFVEDLLINGDCFKYNNVMYEFRERAALFLDSNGDLKNFSPSDKFRIIGQFIKELNETIHPKTGFNNYGSDLHVSFNHADNEHQTQVSQVIEDMEGYANFWEKQMIKEA